MAGLRKQKQYDWKDSNLARFGSDTKPTLKKSSADKDTAWRSAGQKVGLQIWRIVNFKVTNWPEEDYGKFYDGDSYIVLNTYKKEGSDKYLYDVHVWIGKYSTAITRNAALLDGSDVYILDLGLKLYQWNGATSNKDERFRAMQYLTESEE